MENKTENSQLKGDDKKQLTISLKTATGIKKAAGFVAKGFAVLLAVCAIYGAVVNFGPGDMVRTAIFNIQTIGYDKSDCVIVQDDTDIYGGYASKYDLIYTDKMRGKKLKVHVYDVWGSSAPKWDRGRHYSDIEITDI